MTNNTRTVIAFNTGRPYSAAGQRIAATRLDDGRVLFVDHDRALEYVTSEPCILAEYAIMGAYDHNDTTSVYSALQDRDERETVLAKLHAIASQVR